MTSIKLITNKNKNSILNKIIIHCLLSYEDERTRGKKVFVGR